MFNQLANAKKALIYGFAREGKATLHFLNKHYPNIKVDIYDDNIPKYKKKRNLKSYDLISVSAGINRDGFPKSLAEKLTSETELFFQHLPPAYKQRVVGITGTKGKSTTTKLLAEALRKNGSRVVESGNYGAAVLSSFDDLVTNKLDYIICELSSYQLEYLRISPSISVFLNIYPDHLDCHHTLSLYFKAKSSIWRYQTKGDYLVVPRRVLAGYKKSLRTKAKVVAALPFTKRLLPTTSIFRAAHFLEDFGAAQTVAKILKVPQKVFISTAKSFQGLPHRMEHIITKRGISFYDDGNSVNPGATIRNLEFFGPKLGSVILGGQNRNQNFAELLQRIHRWGAHVIIYDSETSRNLTQAVKRIPGAKWSTAKTLQQAVKIAFELTPKGKVCILSPAAPSYDRFKNFQEKGKVFKKAILSYKK